MSDLPDWTRIPPAERDRLLVSYCRAGLTAQAIANKFLNCSRSAAIGRLHRLKLKLNNGEPRPGGPGRTPVAVSQDSSRTLKPAPARRVSKLVQQTSSWRGANNPPATDFKARAEQRAASPGIVIKRENAFDPIPGTTPISLLDLNSTTCRWMVNGVHGRDDLFCGQPKEIEHSYCACHRAIAHLPPTIRQRAGLRSAERIS
ncbi:MAG: hypothetical protein E5X35_07430 [Mesorhizobium sp.]|uniref:GcrA family cell cycle regulator n=1 Tax=Mesorhizobium TaxID=68287 RepID=UPI00122540F0|nr:MULTISPECIES: GcrA family cell cycle regulator [Mesorhizobium]MCF6120864.1 hypothetical protein [Mesorhizobium muleiense]TIR34539.1 MAG: hypothetical protein E5X35_07430 [Mesorhizobium sp.]